MSAEQLLRARIEEIATEIDIQKRILKQLERDKSLVQRQLNEMIFLQYRFPCTEGLAQTLPIWLQRTRNRPLSISLRGVGHFSDWNDGIYAIIWQNGERLQHLSIFDDDDSDEAVTMVQHRHIQLHNSGPLPLLKTLTIGGQERAFLSPQILQLLRLAPNVSECVFNSVKFEGQDNFSFTSESLVLPTLYRLEIAVLVRECRILASSVISFIERTMPPLHELHLNILGGMPMPSILHQCLHLIPSLVRLEFGPRLLAKKESWTTLFSVSGALATRGIQSHSHRE
ncbi:hypothetical protein K438DRAFT_1807836 [Mycena galopus ATCC 62051]|nr:hypothetical protein K438DRAFT_1807836 [Mycena galopus ATCC 62051]